MGNSRADSLDRLLDLEHSRHEHEYSPLCTLGLLDAVPSDSSDEVVVDPLGTGERFESGKGSFVVDSSSHERRAHAVDLRLGKFLRGARGRLV